MMYFKIVCVVFFVCTNYLSNCIDLDKYEFDIDKVPELPEYYDWEPIPTSAFKNDVTKSDDGNETNTPSSIEMAENKNKEEENIENKEATEKEVADDDSIEDIYFAGPVKAKGTVRVGANFGYGVPCPMYPYPWFPPFYYYPFYLPHPDYYFPYFFPDPSIYYDDDDFARQYYELAPNKKKNEKYDEKSLEEKKLVSKSNSKTKSSKERTEILSSGYDIPVSGNGYEAAGKLFGGFVPASGKVKICAHF